MGHVTTQAGMSPARQDCCLFCGHADTVSRPLLPVWADVLLPTDEVARTERPLGRSHRLTCAACADGWMARLADHAQPALAPVLAGSGSTELTISQHRAAAGWLCMTAMLVSSTHRQSMIPRGDRSYIRHTGLPPRSWVMFVGGLSGRSWSGDCAHEPCRIEFAGNPSATRSRGQASLACNTQLLSAGFGPLFLHMLASPSLPLLADFTAASRAAGLTQLWPAIRRFGLVRTAVRLPPERTIDCAQAGRIAADAGQRLRSRPGIAALVRPEVLTPAG